MHADKKRFSNLNYHELTALKKEIMVARTALAISIVALWASIATLAVYFH